MAWEADSLFQYATVFLGLLFLAWISPRLTAFLSYHKRLRALPQAEKSHWLLGHLPVLRATRSSVRNRRREWRKRCPKLHTSLLTQFLPIVSLNNANMAGKVVPSSAPKPKYMYDFLRPWLGDGLLLSNGRKWARDRRLLTHCFHFDILHSYMEVYNDAVGIMLQKWEETCHAGDSVDVSESCTLLTLDIILRCAMGFESNCQLETGAETSGAAKYAQTVKRTTRLIDDRLLNFLHHSDFIYFNLTANGREFGRHLKTLHDMSRHLIAERRAAIEHGHGSSGAHSYRDFLDVLLTVKDEDGKGFSDEEIREQVDTFLFRGHDTTASALQWTVYYLAQHPDLQEKCRKEVQTVLEKANGGLGSIEHEHLREMLYLTQFIKESLRLSAPVPFIARQLAEDTAFDEHTVPAGATVFTSILDCHVSDLHWEDGETFNPERFSPEGMEGRHPFAYVPFSAGPRNCIGQNLAMDELKTVTASLLRRFRISPDPKAPPPIWRPQLVARSENGIRVNLADLQAEH